MTRLPSSVTFLVGAARADQFPADRGAEVAFAGRSNAGKSSALNAVTGHAALARTSKRPGRTREINFFRIDDRCRLVDLPGYGYAQAPVRVQQRWGSLLPGYLASRRSLRGVVLLMDVRRPFTALDEEVFTMFLEAGRPVRILLTKADKLGRGRAAEALARVRARLAGHGGEAQAQLFSALRGTGVEELRAQIERWLQAKKSPGSKFGGEG